MNALVRTCDSRNVEIPLQFPLKVSRVTLHLEASQFFDNRLLRVSFTEENGWNVKEVKIPSDALEKKGKERKTRKYQKKSISQVAKKRNNVSAPVPPEIEEKLRCSENEKILQDAEIETDEKKLMLLKYLLFGSKWFNIAPKCFTVLKEKKKRYKCIECSYTSGESMRVAEHFYTSHNPGKNFICLYCHEEFTTRRRLRSHLLSICKRIPEPHRVDLARQSKSSKAGQTPSP